MKVWITKYCISDGVFEAEAVLPSPGHIYVECKTPKATVWCKLGRDAFDNREAALLDCEDRRKKKIASLRKQITQLDKLRFE